MKIILPASQIPEGEKVTKIGGKVRYTLKKTFKIYSEMGDPKIIAADMGTFFLMGDQGTVNCILGEKELVWEVDELELLNHLVNRHNEKVES